MSSDRITLKILKRILKFFIFAADLLIPKDRNLVVLATHLASYYYDNSKHLFEYLVREPQDLKAIWLTRSREIKAHIDSELGTGHSHFLYSVRGTWALLRARTVCVTHGLNDIDIFYPSPRKNVIHLGHGIALKKVGNAAHHVNWLNRLRNKIDMLPYTRILICSEEEAKTLPAAWGAPQAKFQITGQARNDQIIRGEIGRDVRSQPWFGKRCLLWAPTFRDNGNMTLFPFRDFNPHELNEALTRSQTYLLVRTHVKDIAILNAQDIFRKFDRIINASQSRFPDVESLHSAVSILLTDYSGLLFDFLLTGKPMAFVPYDLESYKESRGLIYPYEEIAIGRHLKTQQDLIQLVDNIGVDTKKDKEARAKLRNRFHHYQDGKSCLRIAQLIKELS